MLPSEKISVAVFLTAVLSVYLLAGWMVLKAFRARRRKVPLPRSDRWALRSTLGLAILGVLCMAYGRLVEPYWLEVVRVRIETLKLRNDGGEAGARPLRIVHLSDIHSDPVARLETRLPDVVAAEKPDLIVFTGDSINTPAALPVFKECLSRLARIAPTFAVKGNWDQGFTHPQDVFGGTGARELDAEGLEVEAAGSRIWIAGAPASAAALIPEVLRDAPRGRFTILLHHYPDSAGEAAASGVDLYLAGHTHGGQVALPFYGALVTLSRHGKRFERGLHWVSSMWLYVNRGIGMEGGPFPRVRFCARPEVTVIEVAPAALKR